MKLTESTLRKIIKEELQQVLSEGLFDDISNELYHRTGGKLGKSRISPEQSAKLKAQAKNIYAQQDAENQEMARKRSELNAKDAAVAPITDTERRRQEDELALSRLDRVKQQNAEQKRKNALDIASRGGGARTHGY